LPANKALTVMLLKILESAPYFLELDTQCVDIVSYSCVENKDGFVDEVLSAEQCLAKESR
jgi:hypothetical protein